MTTYSLGSDEAELARLEAQAGFLRAPTRVLLRESGITEGMRVLDLGTGLGHVAVAVADLVGPAGSVTGIDLDPRMIERAAERAADLPNVGFVEADVTRWRADEPYDAVVGRLIMFHLADPVGALRHHLDNVRAGGRVVLLDYDIGGVRTEPPVALDERMGELIIAAFRAAGADPVIGARLQPILTEAGVVDVAGLGIAQYLSPESPAGPAMVSAVIRSLTPVILAHGLATEAEIDPDTLQARLAEAQRASASVLVPPLLTGAWGARP